MSFGVSIASTHKSTWDTCGSCCGPHDRPAYMPTAAKSRINSTILRCLITDVTVKITDFLFSIFLMCGSFASLCLLLVNSKKFNVLGYCSFVYNESFSIIRTLFTCIRLRRVTCAVLHRSFLLPASFFLSSSSFIILCVQETHNDGLLQLRSQTDTRRIHF